MTRFAFGMSRQAVPVSGTGHALVDLAGVERVESHGEIAAKGLTNSVYDDDSSIKFPSGDYSKSETLRIQISRDKRGHSNSKNHWVSEAGSFDTRPEEQAAHPCAQSRLGKALFTPTGAKECPINPDNISRERTTEIIDASRGGDPDILEDNWRLTSQANKPMINLWIGKTIFTFADNPLKDEES